MRQHVLQTESFKIAIIQSQNYSDKTKVQDYLKFRNKLKEHLPLIGL